MKTEELIKYLDDEMVEPSSEAWRYIRLAKYRIEELQLALDRASDIHKELEVIIGQKCLPSQMSRFVADRLASHPKPSDCQKPLPGAPVIGFSDLIGRWRGGILNAPKNDDPWFDSDQKADEWAYAQSRKLHNSDVWAIWNPECAAVILYHEGLRYKSV